jgi:serine protease Do
MSQRSLNWLKFGGLVSLAFILGLLFAGLLDLPRDSRAQGGDPAPVTLTQQAQRTSRALPGTQPLVQLSEAFAAVAETVRPSVVFITSQRVEQARERRLPPGFEQFFPRPPSGPQIERGQGSGFVVSRDGYILTNAHVVEGAERVRVQLLDRRAYDARVVGVDPLTDVAVVKIEARDLQAATLGSSGDVRVGEWVLAVGNPLGNALTFTVTSGIVSAKGRGQLQLPNRTQSTIQDFIQTDAAINPGNSGGPLVNVRGEVIGINSAIASQTGTYVGYGFAIPIDLAKHVMEQLIASGKVERAALGVLVQDATPEDAAYVGLQEIRGVRVDSFPSPSSPAKRAGLEEGDIIVSVDGKPVEYVAQLQQEVGFRKPGDVVKVEVARKGGLRRTFNVRLTSSAQTAEPAEAETSPTENSPAAGGVVVPSLGVKVETVNADWVEQLGLNPTFRGVLVREVTPGGPADGKLFGVNDGAPDIITAVEGAPVRTEAELRAALRGAGFGGVVSLTVLNAGGPDTPAARRTVRVRLQ